MSTIDGRTALVTGGVTGTGRAIVERLARAGADVVVLSLAAAPVAAEIKHFASADECDALLRDAAAWPGQVRIVQGDAADPAAVERAVAAATALGGTPVDLLVCNAATNTIHAVDGHPLDAWQRVLDVNLTGPFLALRACLPGMRAAGRGRIVAIASTDAHRGSAGYAAYCASKHGLLGLCRTLARELEGSGVTVVTVSPGWIDTPSAHLHASDLPPRSLSPGEVAEIVALALSHAGRGLHGSDLVLAGGDA